jgi:DNA-binding response OmpR family regulator
MATILIVDDTAQNRLGLHDMVLKMGHKPMEAEGLARAKHLLNTEIFDLVVLDLELSGGETGLELLKFIKATQQDFKYLPVIIVSVTTEKRKIISCLQGGADDYLVNPYEEEELRARVSNTLQRYALLKALDSEQGKIRRILRSILPDKVAETVINSGSLPPQRHNLVAVLFSDVVGFTSESQGKSPRDVFEGLHTLFTEFEAIARACRVEKIKTIGDAFMATSGLLTEAPDMVAR